jgi:7-cyano-7-deazaguanine synthase
MKTVLIYSGGLDSTVLLYDLVNAGDRLYALCVNYGQRHVRELWGAIEILTKIAVPHRTAHLGGLAELLTGSSLTTDELAVPEGHYTAENMKQTVVPNRNMILLAIAAGWAVSLKADRIAYAAHSGDHAIYPDCRPEFAQSFETALGLANWQRVAVYAPYTSLGKGDIVRLGKTLSVPFESTWSCYKGATVHCGRCGTCVERAEAFHAAGVQDPTDYADPGYWRSAVGAAVAPAPAEAVVEWR